MTALLLLLPSTPMLFQGQEFAASAPFLYFADFEAELADAIRRGRAEFLTQFPSAAAFEERAALDNPGAPHTFARCKLDFSERETHAEAYALHRDLLQVRHEDDAFQVQRPGAVDGAVLGPATFALRFFTGDHSDDRLLIVNLGADLDRPSIAEPLLAPPAGRAWEIRWSSEEPKYGGSGTASLWKNGCWRIFGESALVLAPLRPRSEVKTTVRRRTA